MTEPTDVPILPSTETLMNTIKDAMGEGFASLDKVRNAPIDTNRSANSAARATAKAKEIKAKAKVAAKAAGDKVIAQAKIIADEKKKAAAIIAIAPVVSTPTSADAESIKEKAQASKLKEKAKAQAAKIKAQAAKNKAALKEAEQIVGGDPRTWGPSSRENWRET